MMNTTKPAATFSVTLSDGTTITRSSERYSYPVALVSIVTDAVIAMERAWRDRDEARAKRAEERLAYVHPESDMAKSLRAEVATFRGYATRPLPVLGTEEVRGFAGSVALGNKAAGKWTKLGYRVDVRATACDVK